MDPPSRSPKRRRNEQLEEPIEGSEPSNTKRLRTSLDRNLEPVSAGDPNPSGRPPRRAASNDDGTLNVSVDDGDSRGQQNPQRTMSNSQSRTEGNELSGTISNVSIVGQKPQTPISGKTGKTATGPINGHTAFPAPTSTRQEDQGIVLAAPPVVRTNHNGLDSGVGGIRNLALSDQEKRQKMFTEHRMRNRELLKKKAEDDRDTALRMVTSLPDQLNIAHISVKEVLSNFTTHILLIKDFKNSITDDTAWLNFWEMELGKKEAKIKALENIYNDLIPITPPGLQGEQQQLKEKSMLTMQENLEKVRLMIDKSIKEIREKNERLAASEKALARSREMVPQLIEDLMKLAPKLSEGGNDQT
ncbi:hypothetical protein N431DRAFT_554032 [Stipitochalara longipes BDJ]|nr:hypothetical protein N431DRAFT_554032 [Stipitochalara longipes BDJ]